MSKGYVRSEQRTVSWTMLDIATGNTETFAVPPAEEWGPGGKTLVARGTLKWQPNVRSRRVSRAA